MLDYEPETGFFKWKIPRGQIVKIGDVAGGKTAHGYLRIQICGKRYMAHRLAWFFVHGEFPKYQIDHFDRDKLNNRIANLREATHGENQQNIVKAHKDGASGFLGVSYVAKGIKKYKAQITLDGKIKYLGCHATPEDAHLEYLKAKETMHPFANIGAA